MLYLNLTKGFNPFNIPESSCIKYESFFFNGGEPHIKLDMSSFREKRQNVYVTSRLTSMNEFMMLIIATEALNQCGRCGSSYLFIPYFPGARQDRRMVSGEPLSVKVFTNIINALGYDCVKTFDNHSDVATALIKNSTNINNHDFVSIILEELYPNTNNFYIVSPDAGANKKIKNLLMDVYHPNLVKCDKTRNVVDGSITGFEVYSNDLKGKDCIIVDDICDGGGTFIGLAKELKKKNAGDIYLIVSHGIFSKPLKELKPYFKKIYTTDSWRSEFDWERNERDTTELVEIIEFKDFM
jgi:ribose-phosphate pyrophosphokinase